MKKLTNYLNQMQTQERVVTAFRIVIHNTEYIVVVIRLDDSRHLCQLIFIDVGDEERKLIVDVPSDASRFDVGVSDLRKFFKIGFCDNIGRLCFNFYKMFDEKVPVAIDDNYDAITKKHIIKLVNRKCGEDGMYCFALMRNGIKNGKRGVRSSWNDEKARLLCPELYDLFGKDKHISFCFSAEPTARTTIDIIEEFQKREN